jgi:glucose/arabinose dehydrogenase
MTKMTLAVLAFVLLGCSGGDSGVATPGSGYKFETVVKGLEVPWSIVFAPDGAMYVTERPGRVRVIRNGALAPKPVYVVPDLVTGSEIGLEGMTFHPNFSANHYVYLAYGYREDAVKVVRYTLQNDALTQDKVIVDNLPAAMNHAGCQIRFGPDAKLYVSVGDATTRAIAQDLNSLGGKILRLSDDGSVPTDNPFVGKAGARPEIWAYGSRNSQGFDWQPGTGAMWEVEHGPSGFDGPGGGDEVNIIHKGDNLGWPLAHHDIKVAGTVPPLRQYTPAEAPATATFYNGDQLPGMKGNFFFCCLKGQGVMRLKVEGSKITGQEKLFAELGRCRAIAIGPDGYIYFSTSNRDGRGVPAQGDDRIVRILPQ